MLSVHTRTLHSSMFVVMLIEHAFLDLLLIIFLFKRLYSIYTVNSTVVKQLNLASIDI
jgi:hypothetical protein